MSRLRPVKGWPFGLTLVLGLGLVGLGAAAEGRGPVVTEVRTSSEPGGLVIAITTTERVSYVLVTDSDPFTLTLYLLSTTFAFPSTPRDVHHGALRKVIPSVLEHQTGRLARLQFVFTQEGPYRLRQDGRRLFVHVDVPGGTGGVVLGPLPNVAAAPPSPEPPPPATSPDKPPRTTAPPSEGRPAVSPPAEPVTPGLPRAIKIHGLSLVEAEAEASVSVEASGPLTYRAFTLTAPARLVLDFDNVDYGLKRAIVPASGPILKRIRSSLFQRTPTKVVRIVFDLERLVPYWIEPTERGVVVHIGARKPR